jgi:hypothetical protein
MSAQLQPAGQSVGGVGAVVLMLIVSKVAVLIAPVLSDVTANPANIGLVRLKVIHVPIT